MALSSAIIVLMLIPSLMVLAGVILLPLAANWLVHGSTALARRVGMSELVIGLTVVALGTSAPELVTGVVGAIRGAPGIVLGNAVGSNIANLGLVLGVAALLGRIPVQRRLVWFDGILMLAITALVWWMAYDGWIGRIDGLILLVGFAGLIWWTMRQGGVQPDESADGRAVMGWGLILLLIGAGIVGLAAGADVLVRGASTLARHFGISETMIGATVVALGTSLPELAASIAAARQRRYNMLLGNLIGSCQFNLAMITGLPAVIIPLKVDASMLSLHLPALAVVSVAAWFALWTRGQVIRREGLVLLLAYIAYMILVFW